MASSCGVSTKQGEAMTPEEVVETIYAENRNAMPSNAEFTREQVQRLMDDAAMRGLKLGSNIALSMVQGSLLVQLARVSGEQPCA